MSISNDQRNQIIVATNGALVSLPQAIRSVSADLTDETLRLQFIHDGELDAEIEVPVESIKRRIADAMPGYSIASEFMRVDAPGQYFDKLLSIVVLAMFEQSDEYAE